MFSELFKIEREPGLKDAGKYQYVVFTDGACSGNPGPGGWSAILLNLQEGVGKQIYGREGNTTNNRMELTAAIKPISQIPSEANVLILSDSKYLVTGITEWVIGWKKNGWMTASEQPVKNSDLWKTLLSLTSGRTIEWRYVKGHAGNYYNEMADKFACSMCKK